MFNQKGQSLLEVVLAIAIFGLLCSSLVTMSLGGFTSLQQGGEYVEAEAYAQQGIEAVRAIQGSAWNKLTVTSTAVTSTGNVWSFVGENTSSTFGKYSQTIIFSAVCRDFSDNITACPGNYTDLNTKQATVTVTWLSTRNAINTVQKFTYLTNWNSRDWTQTDWSGGAGQSIWALTNKYSTDDTNLDNTTSGEIKLLNSGFNCGVKKWTFDTASDYTYDSGKIEVISSLAQLKNITTTTYPSDSPTINPASTHLVSSIDNWAGFSEIATKNGGEVYYQLSDDGGSTWKYWSGSAWTAAGPINYNVASVINSNIETFTTSTKQINFKAFLVGDGSQQVNLDQVQINCSKKYNWDFGTPANYIYNSSLIDVASSLVQLKNLGGASVCSGTATVCSAFLTSPTCSAQGGCSWSGSSTNSTTNSNFTSNANGWTYADWVDGNNKAAGAWQAANGNPTGYVRITTGGQKNVTISGFYHQAFTTTQNNSTGTLSYDWKVFTYNAANLISYRIYIFIDTTTGAPTIGTEVASTTIVGTTAWASRTNIDITSKLATAGTYYVKLAVQQVLNNAAGTPGNSVVGFDNAKVTFTSPSTCSGTPTLCNSYIASSTCAAQTGCSWSGGAGSSFSTTSPSINPTASFSVSTSTFDGWTDFAEVASSTSGGTISYQLSGDGGNTWNYWNGSNWAVAGATNYNSSNVINTNIITFPTSTGQIMFKAFLTSDGSQQIALDNVRVGWGQSAGGGYATAGTFLSSAFNMSKVSPVQILSWGQNVGGCATCNIQMQVRTAPDSTGSPGVWSSWYGANGTSTYFIDYLGTLLPTALNGNQWVQYQANLAGDGSGTPILQEVRVNYK